MSESPQHLALVKKIRNAIRNRKDVTASLVVAEDHEENTTTFQTDEGYRPDVYYYDNKLLLIGEAKTSNDLSNGHSDAQFESYLKYLNTMSNDVKTILYIGVPWPDFIWAKNHFKKIKPNSVSIIIINDFGLEEEI